jgi:acyl-CoA thioester hydrolase
MTEDSSFEWTYEVRWSDLDGHRHVRNSVYSDYATHTRFRLMASHGFDQERLESLGFGPVMLREEIQYRREARLGDALVVNVRCAGLSEDGSHWRVHQDVLRARGKTAAALTVQGGWLDLRERRLIAPPAELADIMRSLPRTGDFERLPSLLRRGR